MHIKGGTSTVGDRLRLFGKEKFKTMTTFAAALKMKPQALNVYLVGQSLPGNTMQAKLRKMGCDINWLITGERILKESEDKRSRNPFEVDLREVLRYLHSSGRGLEEDDSVLSAGVGVVARPIVVGVRLATDQH